MSEYIIYNGRSIPIEKKEGTFNKIHTSWEQEGTWGCESINGRHDDTLLGCLKIKCEDCIFGRNSRSTFRHHMMNKPLQTNNIKGEDKMEKSIAVAFAENNVTEGNLVEKHFGNDKNNDFISGLIMTSYKSEILTEAKRLEALEKD